MLRDYTNLRTLFSDKFHVNTILGDGESLRVNDAKLIFSLTKRDDLYI